MHSSVAEISTFYISADLLKQCDKAVCRMWILGFVLHQQWQIELVERHCNNFTSKSCFTKKVTEYVGMLESWKGTIKCYIYIRCLVVSTNQADASSEFHGY